MGFDQKHFKALWHLPTCRTRSKLQNSPGSFQIPSVPLYSYFSVLVFCPFPSQGSPLCGHLHYLYLPPSCILVSCLLVFATSVLWDKNTAFFPLSLVSLITKSIWGLQILSLSFKLSTHLFFSFFFQFPK